MRKVFCLVLAILALAATIAPAGASARVCTDPEAPNGCHW